MRKYILRQVVSIIPILFIVSVVSFSLVRVLPTDAVSTYLTANRMAHNNENIAFARVELGLDKPILVQYTEWLSKAVCFDFGKSYFSPLKVRNILSLGFINTLQLTLAAAFWIVLLSLLLGIYAARKPFGVADYCGRILALVGTAVPGFVLGFLFVRIFSYTFHLFPVSGKTSALHFFLPSLTLAVGNVALYARMLRNEMLDNARKPFVLYAQVRGISPDTIFKTHVLKNALLPIANTFGIAFGHLIAGSVIIENVFAWPGLGRVITSSILSRDYPVIQGYIILISLVFVVANLLADVCSAMLDPRIRLGER